MSKAPLVSDLKPRQMQPLAQSFRILGDSSRLRILQALLEGEKNVTKIRKLLRISQPTASRHLSILRMSGFAQARRSGKEMFYSIPSKKRPIVKSLLLQGAKLL
jgi:DNA-binding transcriptional ArsR family regulator